MDILLSIPFLIFFPLITSLFLLSPLFTNNEILIRRFAKSIFGAEFVYTILLYLFFSPANPYEANLSICGLNWIQSIGVRFLFEIDSIRMILVILTAFIFLIAAFASKLHIRKNHKFYYSMLLLLQSAILGIFTANDMFVFFMFWELELIPAYFLIGNDWGNISTNKINGAKNAAMKFIIFTFAGSMFMLLGMLLLHYFNYVSTGILTAKYSDLNVSNIPLGIQILISICFVLGFGVKLPIVPLHTWLPDAHTEAPTPISIILAGILLKTGAYGLFMYNFIILKDSFGILVPYLVIFALINIIFTAFVAFAQTDIKRIVAYSSISNMGLILLGLCACNSIGLEASIFHIVAHALITAGLFEICGIVYLRCKTRDINSIGGIAKNLPRLFGFATLIVLASIGIPAFAPFISEILTIIAAMTSEMSEVLKFAAIFSLPLLILSSCYMLKFLHLAFMGEQREQFENINDISMHEFIILAMITFGLVLFGLFPNTILNMVNF